MTFVSVDHGMTRSKTLIDAILEDDVASVDAAIAAGADVNAIPTSGYQPPLHVAIEHQRFEIVRRLILAGVKINTALLMPGCDLGDGWTPLTHAIDIESDAAWQAYHETGHESIALTELLLVSGAEPNTRAFQLAESYGNRKALELLRQYGGTHNSERADRIKQRQRTNAESSRCVNEVDS